MRILVPALPLLVACSLLAACNGGVHKRGERMAVARIYGSAWPIKGKAIAWHGESDDENIGAGVGNYWFLRDRFAVGGLVSIANYQYAGENVIAGQLEGNARWYVLEHDEYAYFWDAGFGAIWSEAAVPQNATRYEFTFAFGPGMEIPITENSVLQIGVQFHHMSNALGRDSSQNPSQNEFRLWLSWGWLW